MGLIPFLAASGALSGKGPLNPGVNPGITQPDITNSVNTTNDAQQRQQQFLNALTSQQNGIGNENTIFSSGMNTLQNLQNQAQGGGPNPALAQLANTTGQNVQNQAALLAGQRGVGVNPGLAARQIGQIGAGAQQQAVGQAATLRAQQQLAAQQQLQQQQNFLGSLAAQQVGHQQQALSTYGNMGLGQQGQFLQAQADANRTSAGLTQQGSQSLNQLLGGILGGASTVAAAALSQGGAVHGKASVEGDSEKNDTVPAMLSPGEVVIPRSHVKDPKKVAEFINKTLGMNLKVGKS